MSPFLSAGEVATVAIIAADRRQARTIFRYMLGLLDAVPSLAGMVQNATGDTITLGNRVGDRNSHREFSGDARLHLRRRAGGRNGLLA